MTALAGRRALITQGMTLTVGGPTALCLAREGADVIIAHHLSAARRPIKTLKSIEAALVLGFQSFGRTLHVMDADTGSVSGIETLFRNIRREGLQVDILVNCHGSPAYPVRRLDAFSKQTWLRAIAIEGTAALWCALEAIPHMRKVRWGRIINVGVNELVWKDALERENPSAPLANAYPFLFGKRIRREITSLLAPAEFHYGITVNNLDVGGLRAMTSNEVYRFIAGTYPEGVHGLQAGEAIVLLCSEVCDGVTASDIQVPGDYLQRRMAFGRKSDHGR